MSCYHPLKGFPVGSHISGKPAYKIVPYTTDYLWKFKDDEVWHKGVGELNYNPKYSYSTEYVEIPCGKCIGCRLEYSRQWADRCMLEAQEHEQSYFVTLTYDDEHVPRSSYEIEDTGECGDTFTLCKRDFQLFMKRLRKNYKHDNKLRFFMCGEYGTHTLRPHYHVIIFGLKLDDLQFYKKSSQNFNYYNSEFLQKCWKKGYVVITDVSWETCAYTARYVMKKANGQDKDFFELHNMEPEFVLMSRKPGIARNYFDEHKDDIYLTDEIIFSTSKGGKSSRPPRYFDQLFELERPDVFENIKEKRSAVAEALRASKMANTDLSYPELLEVEEHALQERTKALKRIDI